MKHAVTAAVAALSWCATAGATPVLQFDVNSFNAQAQNSSHQNASFGGVNHTGSISFSLGAGILNGIFIQTTPNGPFQNAGLSGFTLTGVSGEVNLVNGQVTGGSFTIRISNNDSYTCNITPNSGHVSTFVGGGFKVEALTNHGLFNDATFGNVNVASWFNAQGSNGLPGSLLQFNFNPNAQGFASSDMDLFVDVVGLPPAAWGGLAMLAGVAVTRRLRRS